MAEYIEREAAIDCLHFVCVPQCRKYAQEEIKKLPTADVQPVRHGRWLDKPGGTYQRMQSWCSVCGKRSGIGGIESNRHKPYCPNCGALMDREANE